MTVSTFLAALALALVHAYAGKLQFLRTVPRHRWLSFAGGVSVAYVFVHILPELAQAQRLFDGIAGSAIHWLERHVYIFALAGFAMFYSLQRVVLARRRRVPAGIAGPGDLVFWMHVASFGAYNGIIGYLLQQRANVYSLAGFSLAMALHFLVTDYGMREDHQALYDRYGRWLLCAAILLGWALGVLSSVPKEALGMLLGFLAGGIVLNVIKEELPRERESRVAPFLVGAVLSAAVLLSVA